MEDLISIIVPVYNAERYLEKCLHSLLMQTYKKIEVIVINDGSTDGSFKILEKYLVMDSRVKIYNQKNLGLSAARNRGLKEANGKYILFVDSDDWIEDNTCELAYEEMVKNHVDVVFWSYKREYTNVSKTTLLFGNERIAWNSSNISELYRRLIGLTGRELSEPQKIDSLITVWGKLYRKESIGEVRFVDTKIIGTEDALFNIQVFSNIHSAVYIPETLSHYRKDNLNSLTHKYKKKLVSQWAELYRQIKNHLEQINASEEYYCALSNRISLGLIGLGLNLAEDDSMSFVEKRRELKCVLEKEQYCSSLSSISLECFPIKWKIFFWCAKYKKVSSLCILLTIMNYLRGK